MPLSSDNQRRLSDVQGVIQSVDPVMLPEKLAQHPRYPRVESLLASYLGNIGLGYWTSGDAAEQSRRRMARAILFLTQVLGGQMAIQQIAATKETTKAKSAQLLLTELTQMLALYRRDLPVPPVPTPRIVAVSPAPQPPDISPVQAQLASGGPLVPPPEPAPDPIPVAPEPPPTPVYRMPKSILARTIVGADLEAIRNRARWPTRPGHATQFAKLATNPADFPFEAGHVNLVLTNVDNFFRALQLADLMERLGRVQVNIEECLDAAQSAFTSYNQVVAAANEDKRKLIGLAMKIVGGGLAAVGGPLGGLLGNLLVEGIEKVVHIALDAAAVSKKASDALSTTGAGKAVEFIEGKLQAKMFLTPASDASIADIKTRLRLQFAEFRTDIVNAIKHGVNEVTHVVEVPGRAVTADQRRSAVMALLWTMFEKRLKLISGDYLVAAVQDELTELSADLVTKVYATFKLNHFQFADKGDLARYFELRFLARLVLDLSQQDKSVPDKVVDAFVRLGVVGKWTKGFGIFGKSGDQERAEIRAAGKIRYGGRHASEREKLMLRTMCKFIDQRVQPMDVALGRIRAEAVDNQMKDYARAVTDYVEQMKSQGTESQVTAQSLEEIGNFTGQSRTRR